MWPYHSLSPAIRMFLPLCYTQQGNSISRKQVQKLTPQFCLTPAKFRENTEMRFWVTVRKLNVTDRQTDRRTDRQMGSVPGPSARREIIKAYQIHVEANLKHKTTAYQISAKRQQHVKLILFVPSPPKMYNLINVGSYHLLFKPNTYRDLGLCDYLW